MVDAERLSRILTRVRRDVAALRTLDVERDLAADETALAAVKYHFLTAIEGCVRAASHVASSEGLGIQESSADAVRLLGRHDTLDDFTRSLAAWGADQG